MRVFRLLISFGDNLDYASLPRTGPTSRAAHWPQAGSLLEPSLSGVQSRGSVHGPKLLPLREHSSPSPFAFSSHCSEGSVTLFFCLYFQHLSSRRSKAFYFFQSSLLATLFLHSQGHAAVLRPLFSFPVSLTFI